MIVRVVLPLPLDQAYSYRVPEPLVEDVRVGSRVLVPFGPRRLTGLVVEAEAPDVPGVTLKAVLDVLDDEPSFTPEMLRLTRWMADYYVCGWGEVVRAALPAGTDVATERRLRRTAADPGAWADHPTGRAVLDALDGRDGLTLAGLRQDVSGVPLALLRRMEADGVLTISEGVSAPKVSVKTEKHLRFAPAFRHRAAARELREQLRGKKQVAVLEALDGFAAAGTPEPRQADVLSRAEASAPTVRTLLARGVVEVVEKEVVRSPLALSADAPTPRKHRLHPAQEEALQQITAAVEAQRFEAFLLHGVTGSGKTEVYIAALKRVLAAGRTGIVLVPEIALTPQTVRRFQAHFGDRVAVLHSRMSLGERYDAWRHLRGGRFTVAIGPRSAVLAPLQNLGLVVVDEEHEASYKQFDPAPRYHARDVAVMRAHMNGAAVVLGSATPSLESWQNAQSGKHTLLPMPDRVPVTDSNGASAIAPMPGVQVIDLTKHMIRGAFSGPLMKAIRDRLDRGEQTILLQNRRGYAPVLECQRCGFTPTCPDCSVSFTYHKAKRHLRCHYCGRTARPSRTCPSCGQDAIQLLGTGTQRVEEELAERVPEARILRMDLDTTGRKDAHHTLLSAFGRGEADVLLGTQMVAKGLDFPRVTLVGVIDADAGMLLPDFRSDERTFQLLTQVAGRAGRAGLRGEVILQTRNPDHAAIRFATRHDYHGFAAAALPDRRAFGYPPFGRVVGVEFRGPHENALVKVAEDWTARFVQAAPALDVLGPTAAFVAKVKRQYRMHTLIKVPRQVSSTRGSAGGLPPVQHLLRQTNDAFGSPPKGVRIAIDVDAVGLF